MSYGSDAALTKCLDGFAIAAAVLSVVIGLWVMVGWTLRIAALLAWGAGTAMAPNSAACMMLAGTVHMSPIAAGAFLLPGLALLGIDWRTRRKHWPAQYLCLVSGIGPVFGLLGLMLEPNVVVDCSDGERKQTQEMLESAKCS